MQTQAAQPANAFTSVVEGVPVTGELLGVLLPSAMDNQDTQVIAQTHPEVNKPEPMSVLLLFATHLPSRY